MLKSELQLTQDQMDKYDKLMAKIKTWAITLWAAVLGWSFQVKRKEIILLAIFAALIFWILDAVNKNFRQDYKKRRDEIILALQNLFKNSLIPSDFVSPDLPKHK